MCHVSILFECRALESLQNASVKTCSERCHERLHPPSLPLRHNSSALLCSHPWSVRRAIERPSPHSSITPRLLYSPHLAGPSSPCPLLPLSARERRNVSSLSLVPWTPALCRQHNRCAGKDEQTPQTRIGYRDKFRYTDLTNIGYRQKMANGRIS